MSQLLNPSLALPFLLHSAALPLPLPTVSCFCVNKLRPPSIATLNNRRRNSVRQGGRGQLIFCMSIDVGKEENSFVDVKADGSLQVDSDFNRAEGEPEVGAEAEAESDGGGGGGGIPRLGVEEKFAVVNTGKYECSSCGYIYDQAKGEQMYPIAPGLEFWKLPQDWRCPTCGAAQSYFVSKSIEVAGFAENQRFGLGANSLTSSQKSALIFGSLLFLFSLFLFGYFLQ